MPTDPRLIRALEQQILERRHRILRLRTSSTAEARHFEDILTAEMNRLLEDHQALTSPGHRE